MFRLILFVIAMCSLNACSLGGGPAPQDHFYQLPEVVLEAQPATLFNELVLKPVKSSGLYHERAILFIESDKPLELQRYHYRFWSTTPAELIHNALYQGLQSSHIATHIARDLSASRPDAIIDCRVIHFERIINNAQVTVNVELEISVRKGSGTGQVWSKRYNVKKPLTTTAMHPSAEAFGSALKDIAGQLVADLMAKK